MPQMIPFTMYARGLGIYSNVKHVTWKQAAFGMQPVSEREASPG